jgi:hypothetical protein
MDHLSKLKEYWAVILSGLILIRAAVIVAVKGDQTANAVSQLRDDHQRCAMHCQDCLTALDAEIRQLGDKIAHMEGVLEGRK